MSDIWQFRERYTENLAQLDASLSRALTSKFVPDLSNGSEHEQITSKIEDFRRGIDAWRFLHPRYRYVLLVGRTSSGKSSIGNCLLARFAFDTDPNEKTAKITFLGSEAATEALKTLRDQHNEVASAEGPPDDTLEDHPAEADSDGPTAYKRLDEVPTAEAEYLPTLDDALVLIDSPGFGTKNITHLKHAGRAKELLRGMLPLVDHIVYVVQPDNPMNDIDGTIIDIIKDELDRIPFTLVMAKTRSYLINKDGQFEPSNVRTQAFNSAIQTINEHLAPFRREPLTRGVDLFHVETDSGKVLLQLEVVIDGKSEPRLVQVGRSVTPDLDDPVRLGAFEEGIEALRTRVFAGAVTDDLAEMRRGKMRANWGAIIGALQSRRLYFVQRTERAHLEAQENEKEYREIVRSRGEALQEFWEEAQQSIALLRDTSIQKIEILLARSRAAIGGVLARLAAIKEEIVSKRATEWSENLRQRISSAAQERARSAADNAKSRVKHFLDKWDDTKNLNIASEVNKLGAEIDEGIMTAHAFKHSVGDDFFTGIEGDPDLKQRFEAAVEDAIKKGITEPKIELDNLLSELDFADQHKSLDQGLDRRIRTTVEGADKSLRMFRKIVSLDASNAVEQNDQRDQEYEAAFSRALKAYTDDPANSDGGAIGVAGNGAPKEQASLLRSVVTPSQSDDQKWRDRVQSELGQVAANVHGSVDGLNQEVRTELLDKVDRPLSPALQTIQNRVNEVLVAMDRELKEALRARSRSAMAQLRVEMEQARRGSRKQLSQLGRVIALSVAVLALLALGMGVILLAGPSFDLGGGIDVGELRTTLTGNLLNAMLALAGAVALVAFYIAVVGRAPGFAAAAIDDFLALFDRARSTSVPPNSGVYRKPSTPDASAFLPAEQLWTIDSSRWEPAQSAIARTFSSYADALLAKYRPAAVPLERRAQQLQGAASSLATVLRQATDYLVVQFADSDGSKRKAFEAEVLRQRDGFTRTVFKFFVGRQRALSQFDGDLNSTSD